MIFYVQDSDDVYGRFIFHPDEDQQIQSDPSGRFLSLSFLREGGRVGRVQLALSVLYQPVRPIDLPWDGVLNGSSVTNVLFEPGQHSAQVALPIRNDAFLQNGALFLIQVGWTKCVITTDEPICMNKERMSAFNPHVVFTTWLHSWSELTSLTEMIMMLFVNISIFIYFDFNFSKDANSCL